MVHPSLFLVNDERSGAQFSECRKYRYALWRIWDTRLPLIMFIGLNPSTANETETDPTITRVVGFAKNWAYGGVYMMNLFAYVTSYPEELRKCADPLGDNNGWLESVGLKCRDVIFAWGNFKEAKQRASEVIKMFPYARALVLNKDGSPRHPLYVPGNVETVSFFKPR